MQSAKKGLRDIANHKARERGTATMRMRVREIERLREQEQAR